MTQTVWDDAPEGETPRQARLKRLVLSLPGLIVIRLLIVGAVLLAWEAMAGSILPKFWFSSPSAILSLLWRWMSTGLLWRHLEATLLATGVGYVIGCAVGIAAGLLLGFLPRVQRILAPYLSGLYALPKIALAPLFVIILGIDIESKIALVAITVFFLLLYATLDGINDIDRDLLQSLRLMGASRRELGTKVMIPATMPWIFSAMRIAVRYALTAAILGEVIAANRGIGYLIEANAGQYNATGVFAAVLVLVLVCVAVTEMLTRAETSTSRGGR